MKLIKDNTKQLEEKNVTVETVYASDATVLKFAHKYMKEKKELLDWLKDS
jgi:hypothetical protein